MPSNHQRRRRRNHNSSNLFLLFLLPTASALHYPLPASIFKTHTSTGNPILHIQPSLYHSSTSRTLLNFKSVFLANPSPGSYIDSSLLYNGDFTQDVDGVQVPNFLVGGGEGVVVFSRKGHLDDIADGRVGRDTGEVWLMTFPVVCDGGDGVGGYTIYRSGAGKEDWEEIKLNPGADWSPSSRYLGRGFMADIYDEEDGSSVLTGGERLYSFGGVCIGGEAFLGNGRNDTFSADVWRVENSTAVLDGGEGLRRRQIDIGDGEDETVWSSTASEVSTALSRSIAATASGGVSTVISRSSVWSETRSLESESESESATSTGVQTTRTIANSKSTTFQTSSLLKTPSSISTKPTSTTAITSTPTPAAKEENTDPSSSLDILVSTSKNPPIPEAGFSMTPLKSTNPAEGNATSMLILGGYTSSNRFVGLGQLALFTPQSESWTFVSTTLSNNNITPRAGHTAVLDPENNRIIIFGGWIGNITRPATPPIITLKIGDLTTDGQGWEWETYNATEEIDGAGPANDLSLWGHAGILLEGNVMMLTSGFHVEDLDDDGRQRVNDQTWFLNLTSNEWVSQYHYPIEELSKNTPGGEAEGKQGNHRDIAMLAGVFGGVALLVVVLAVLFWYARRQEEYADLTNDTAADGDDENRGDKFDSLDLEYGKTAGVGQTNLFRSREITGTQLRENMPRSPELPPRPPAPTRAHRHANQPSHVDMEMVERMREQQEQRENMFQESAAQERRRSVRSEMVAWVREWANADAAAQAAEVMTRQRQESGCSGRGRKESSTLGSGGVKDMYLRPGRAANNTPKSTAATTGAPETVDSRCITSSSTYSDGQVSTLDASENYTTPEEIPYPVPPMLLSTCQTYGEQSPRNPRLLVGPQGVTAPLPKKMAEEFPTPTLIPRDSLSSSAHGSGVYNHYSYSSTKPLLVQAQSSTTGDRDRDTDSEWRDVTPASHFFTNIPLTTFEEDEQQHLTPHIKRGKSLEDRVREEMYNPGPARTDDDCRLSSIMDYYAESKSPTPIPELTEGTDSEDDEGEEGYLVPSVSSGIRSSTFDGEHAVVEGKGKMVYITNTAVDEPIVVRSIRMRSQGHHQPHPSRESVIAPLLSETLSQQQKEDGKLEKPIAKSRIPSLGSSIKRRAAAMAATFNPSSSSAQSNDRRSSSMGRKNVLCRRQAQTGQKPAQTTVSESTPLQPQQAEIMNVNDQEATDLLLARGFEDRDDGSSMHMNDKVVQLVYTAPKGKLRVVNPSPRRVSSGGTDGSFGLFQQMAAQRRVSSSGNLGGLAGPEGIVRLGSAAARKVGELD
ncbi:hypothetical protein TWF481_003304 [Arthrobotrys musiformis]|uniref:Uncharacterized protein n=1 Tax=Arthrobotrys musiformis TaxID=47236 RepID=A0AAV9VSU7_9PEZI